MRDANNLHQWAVNFYPTKTIKIDANNFKNRVLEGSDNDGLPWLIDFYAPWCGPCNAFAPKFEMIAERLEGIVKCGKVNCQENQGLCQKAGITGYPSIMFYPKPNREALNPVSYNKNIFFLYYQVLAW